MASSRVKELLPKVFARELNHLSNLRSEKERLKYLRKINSKFSDTVDFIADRKNNRMAEAAKAEGNQYYGIGDFLEALKNYNKALCLAVVGSETEAQIYANRSAAFLAIGEYERSMENVELALKGKYPKEQAPKLEQRRMKCEEKLKKPSKKEKPYEGKMAALSYPPLANNPFMADCIKLDYQAGKGVRLLANRDIAPGDNLLIDNSLVGCLIEECLHLLCSNCLQPNGLNLLACPGCTKIMFCSETCRQEANQRFHDFECPVLASLYNQGDVLVIYTRLLFLALKIFPDANQISEVMNEVRRDPLSIIEGDFSHDPEPQRLKFHLLRGQFHHSDQTEFQHSITMLQLVSFVLRHTSVGSQFQKRADREVMEEFSLMLAKPNLLETWHHFQLSKGIVKAQVFVAETFSPLFFDQTAEENNLLRRNCADVKVGPKGSLLYATKPIEEGQQLYLWEEGQEEFSSDVFAQVFKALLFQKKGLDVEELIRKPKKDEERNQAFLEEKIQKCKEFLEANQDKWPCSEIFDVQKAIKRAKRLIYDVQPYDHYKD